MLIPQSSLGSAALAWAQEPQTNSAEKKDEATKSVDIKSKSRELRELNLGVNNIGDGGCIALSKCLPREMKLEENRAPKVSQLEVREEVNYDEKKDNPADHDERCGCSSCVLLRRARAEGLATHSEICVECYEVAPGHDDAIGLFYCETCWKTHSDIIVSATVAPVASSRKCSNCGLATENLLMCDNCLRMQWYPCPGQNVPVGGEVGVEAHVPDNEETKVEHLMQDYDDVLGTDPYGFRDTSPRAVTPDTEPPVSCTEDMETLVEDKPDDDIASLQCIAQEAGNTGEQPEDGKTDKVEMNNRENPPISCAGNTKPPSSRAWLLKTVNTKAPSSRTELLEIEDNQQKAHHNPWSANTQESSAIRNDGVKLVQALIRDFSIIKKTAASPST